MQRPSIFATPALGRGQKKAVLVMELLPHGYVIIGKGGVPSQSLEQAVGVI